MSKTLRFRYLMTLFLMGLILAGCGGSSSDSSLAALGGPNSGQVGTGSGPVNFGPGTGTPGVFTPPTTPTTPPPFDPDTDAALVSISASPNPLSVYIGDTAQLTVTGLLDDGSSVALVNSSDVSVSFSTVSNTAAIVSPTGLVTGIWFGSETVTVTAVVGGVTRSTTVPVTVTVSLQDLLFNSLFFEPIGSSWLSLYETVVVEAGITYPIISYVDSFDPLLAPPQVPGTRTLSLEVPSDSRGGISQVVNLPALGANEALYLDFSTATKLNPVTLTVEVNGPSSSVSENFTPPALYSAPSVPAAFPFLFFYQMDVSALAGETVEVRFLATSSSPPGAPGDTSVAIRGPVLAVWPTAPYDPGTVVGP